MKKSERICLACQGTHLRFGAVPDAHSSIIPWRLQFKPEGNWIKSHEIRAYACLDCGQLGFYLDSENIDALRG
jgi:hypothetical protein